MAIKIPDNIKDFPYRSEQEIKVPEAENVFGRKIPTVASLPSRNELNDVGGKGTDVGAAEEGVMRIAQSAQNLSKRFESLQIAEEETRLIQSQFELREQENAMKEEVRKYSVENNLTTDQQREEYQKRYTSIQDGVYQKYSFSHPEMAKKAEQVFGTLKLNHFDNYDRQEIEPRRVSEVKAFALNTSNSAALAVANAASFNEVQDIIASTQTMFNSPMFAAVLPIDQLVRMKSELGSTLERVYLTKKIEDLAPKQITATTVVDPEPINKLIEAAVHTDPLQKEQLKNVLEQRYDAIVRDVDHAKKVIVDEHKRQQKETYEMLDSTLKIQFWDGKLSYTSLQDQIKKSGLDEVDQMKLTAKYVDDIERKRREDIRESKAERRHAEYLSAMGLKLDDTSVEKAFKYYNVGKLTPEQQIVWASQHGTLPKQTQAIIESNLRSPNPDEVKRGMGMIQLVQQTNKQMMHELYKKDDNLLTFVADVQSGMPLTEAIKYRDGLKNLNPIEAEAAKSKAKQFTTATNNKPSWLEERLAKQYGVEVGELPSSLVESAKNKFTVELANQGGKEERAFALLPKNLPSYGKNPITNKVESFPITQLHPDTKPDWIRERAYVELNIPKEHQITDFIASSPTKDGKNRAYMVKVYDPEQQVSYIANVDKETGRVKPWVYDKGTDPNWQKIENNIKAENQIMREREKKADDYNKQRDERRKSMGLPPVSETPTGVSFGDIMGKKGN